MKSMYDFYMEEIQSQYPGTMAMTSGGWHIDTKALVDTRRQFAREIADLSQQLEKLVGWVPNTKSGIDMEKLLKQLGIPVDNPQYRTKPTSRSPRGAIKRGEDDLLNYCHKYPDARPILGLCIETTTRRTLSSNFLTMALDPIDHYHPTYRLNGTKSGRYASEGADEGGPQGQNWPHDLLNLVIPDACPLHHKERLDLQLQSGSDRLNSNGYILCSCNELTEADLSQAEDMIIAYDSLDKVAIDAFTRNIDSHRLKACWAFRGWEYNSGLPLPDMLMSISIVCDKCAAGGKTKCNHSERFISKSSGYAFKYKMGVRKFITRQLVPAGVFISEAEGKRIRDRIVSPPTVRWQNDTDAELSKTRWLTNLLGRKRNFYGLHDTSGEMLREALSWKAQSVVGIIAGRAVTRLHKRLPTIGNGARLLTQRHDSVLISHKVGDRALVQEAIQEAFYSPINAHGRILNIPLEFKSGPNWRDLH